MSTNIQRILFQVTVCYVYSGFELKKKIRLINFKYNYKNIKITVLPANSQLPFHCNINSNTNKCRHLFFGLVSLLHLFNKVVSEP